jgi:Arc/MetJ-type ribon-helix-helix transcriptional regulator
MPEARPEPRSNRAPRQADGRVTIKIPRALYRRIRGLVDGSGFSSPTEFIVWVLRDLLAESGNGDALSRDEVRAVRTRLKNLGYLAEKDTREEPPR